MIVSRSGLGLAVVQRIVRSLGGAINLTVQTFSY
jgi:hypothetical protein